MLTSFRGLAAASLLAGTAAIATPALAGEAAPELQGPVLDTSVEPAAQPVDYALASHQGEADGPITVSANVALTTDYRFRGVSLSGGDPAIQGGLDIGHSSGFYAGTWASSIDGGPAYGELELDVYAGYSAELSEGLTFDVGILYYIYPTEDIGANVNYWEPYASLGFTLGPAEATVGVAYAWDQDSLGSEDNLYVYTDLSAGIPSTPLTLDAHLGYTDGVLAPPLLAGALDDTGFDWSVGASMNIYGPLSASVSYVGVEGPSIDGFTDDTVVVTLSAEF